MSLGVGEVFAGYTVVRQIGNGGMGEVYLAQHPRLPRQEALKVLRPEISSDDSFRQRFIREADSIAALEHPNIVTVHDRGENAGRLWIATQYVDGADAAQLLRDRYPAGMPTGEASTIITAIAEALDHAHDRGLLHRDVKPANILLTHADRDGTRRIYLADFGIARPLDDPIGLTSTNFALGTFAYAAPEQLMGKAIDGRADQYALAATAYHLLTGTPVFPDPNQIAVISQHLTEPAPAPSSVRPALAPLDTAFARALAKNPNDRYSSCRDFAHAITAATASQSEGYSPTAPTQQAPIPAPQATTSPSRRSPATAILPAAVLLGLVAGGALLWHPWDRRDQTPISTSTSPTPSTTSATDSTTTAPAAAPSSTPPPAPPPPSARTSAVQVAQNYPPAGALGQWCSNPGGIGTGQDGSLYYCARLEYTDGYQWSRTPGVIPNPAVPPYTPPPASEVDPLGPKNGDPCPVLGVRARGPWGLVECINVGLGPTWGGPR